MTESKKRGRRSAALQKLAETQRNLNLPVRGTAGLADGGVGHAKAAELPKNTSGLIPGGDAGNVADVSVEYPRN